MKDNDQSLRKIVYDILERGSELHRVSLLVNRSIVLLIVVNLIAMILESIPALLAAYRPIFVAIEYVSLALFTLEYIAIVWCAVEHPPYKHLASWQARVRQALSVGGIVDLLAVLPFWIALFTPIDLRALLVFRIIRFLKLTRYSPAMRSLLDALYSERRALFGCLIILFGATLMSATFMHVVEGDVQPAAFGTIPDAMWWALVTLATVGYGDVVPVTVLGKLVAAGTIVTGLVMIALPVGIIASAFSDEVHRRDFVVTWGMVARVPLFAGFDAREIAEVMQMLRAQSVEAGTIIVRRGEQAHSMYFIATGKVEIELPDKNVRLGGGQFFGEVAVLKRTQRTATVTALKRCDLLVLEADDLHTLMARDPRISHRIRQARQEIFGDAGDLTSIEITTNDSKTARS